MSLVNAVSRPLYGAYRLARLDPEGLTYFDITPAGFWFSFFAAVLSFPFYVVIMGASWMESSADVAVWRIIVVELITYVIAWTAFPVIMPLVVRAMDREQHYIRGIVAYNWASVIQNVIYLPVALLGSMGVIDDTPISLIVLVLLLFYSGYVMKVALDIRPLLAFAIIFLDVMISAVLNHWSSTILYG